MIPHSDKFSFGPTDKLFYLSERSAAALALGEAGPYLSREEKNYIGEDMNKILEQLLESPEKVSGSSDTIRKFILTPNEFGFAGTDWNPEMSLLKGLVIALGKLEYQPSFDIIAEYFQSAGHYDWLAVDLLGHRPDMNLMVQSLYEINPKRAVPVVLKKLKEITERLAGGSSRLTSFNDDYRKFFDYAYTDFKIWDVIDRFFSESDKKTIEAKVPRIKYRAHGTSKVIPDARTAK